MEKRDDYFFDFLVPMMLKEKKEKITKYKHLNQFVKKGETLMVGSSLMDNFPINELQQSLGIKQIIYNRGIGGTVTTELLASMDECIFDLEPSKMFINIGTNDIGAAGYTLEALISNYADILTQVKTRIPECKVFVMAYYPINSVVDYGLPAEHKEGMFKTRTNEAILKANKSVEKLACRFDYEYIDVNEGLMDEEGNLKSDFAIEGLHMWPQAYAIVLNNLKKYL